MKRKNPKSARKAKSRGRSTRPSAQEKARGIKRPQGRERAAALPKGAVLTGLLLNDRKPKIIPLYGAAQAKVDIVGDMEGYVHGDIVRARVLRMGNRGIYDAELIERLSTGNDAPSRMRAMAAGFGLRMEFAQEVLDAAQQASAAAVEGELASRVDYRKDEVFTIDGADAQDFDDAVAIDDAPSGMTRLSVHIADVSHYVRPGSPIEEEAYARGTSVYFPGMVLPMLPEALSNGSCSLRPGEDRLVLSCVMDVDAAGIVRAYTITRGVIRSCRRFTYDEVNALLDDPVALEGCAQGKSLARLQKLSHVLHKKRVARGAVDIDLPEAKILVDKQGEVKDIIAPARGEGERLIEECMLLANETVARHLEGHDLPALYRVHEDPDPEKIETLRKFAKKAGLDVRALRNPVKPEMMDALLVQAKEQSIYPALSMLTMRSMQKARYDKSPLGHFGLAAEDYCHFTSPIRRYPDLFVHRALGSWMDEDAALQKALRKAADAAGEQSSKTEVTATEAERTVDKMMMARWAEDHLGEVFDGVITGVSASGFFTALPNMVEGMTPVWTLRDEFVYDEGRLMLRGLHTGVKYTVGDKLRVRIDAAQPMQGRIDFALVTAEK